MGLEERANGHDDEQPSSRVSIDKPFWMATFEMTNEQFNRFNPEHDGAFKPNAWGLYDMHGNAAEWTRSAFKPYPYNRNDGRNTPDAAQNRVVRGGSWRDRQKRCTSSFRLSYPQWQRVFNVGFRITIEASDKSTHLAQATKH